MTLFRLCGGNNGYTLQISHYIGKTLARNNITKYTDFLKPIPYLNGKRAFKKKKRNKKYIINKKEVVSLTRLIVNVSIPKLFFVSHGDKTALRE